MNEVEIKKDWVTKAGLRAVILLVRGSHHAGYVAIEKGYPLFGKSPYDGTLESIDVRQLEVHGGVTYSKGALCDVSVIADNLWWLGFDCMHLGDLSLDPVYSKYQMDDFHCTFKDVDYCVAECEHLAEQIVEYQTRKLEEFIGG